MTSFSEQLSVRTSQWEAQLDLFRQLSDRALESTEQLMALNLRTSRTSVEQAAGTLKQLLEASDPRDLFAVSSAAQGQVHQLFAYGRELLGIASGMRTTWSTLPVLPSPLRLLPSPSMNVASAPAQLAEPAAAQPAAAEFAAQKSAIAAPAAEPAAQAKALDRIEAEFEASVETAIADEVPPLTPTMLAKALNEAAPKPASVEHPIVSTVPLEAAEAADTVELPMVAPVEHSAPVQQAQGPEAKRPRPTRRK